MPTSRQFPAAICLRNINTENSVIKPPFWISVNFSDILQTQMKQDKQSFCITISRREKHEAQPIISYMEYLIMVNMSFSQNTDVFVSFSTKLMCQILLQGISDSTNFVKNKKSRKICFLIQFHVFSCN